MIELYKKYRPTTFKGVVGQESAVRMLLRMVKSGKVPHTLLFTGASGCGKTTLARIMKEKLQCGDHDFIEINCADHNGIAMVRDIRGRLMSKPMSGPCRIWLIDECHQLTGDAQDAFLKILEDTPQHVYFILATTNGEKLKPTIKTRCTTINLEAISNDVLEALIKEVAKKERVKLSSSVVEKIAECADGSARKALVLLHQIIELDNEDEQLNALQKVDVKTQAIELVRILMKPKVNWSEITAKLKTIDEEPESIRRMVLVYTSSVMRNNRMPARCYLIIRAFADPYYDTGKAGLDASCWEVCVDCK